MFDFIVITRHEPGGLGGIVEAGGQQLQAPVQLKLSLALARMKRQPRLKGIDLAQLEIERVRSWGLNFSNKMRSDQIRIQI